MFGGFGSRFAKFGTGGGGRAIASATDLLQLFKRGSEDGAMLDELDNTTDLEFANVNALTGSTSFVTFDGESTTSADTFVFETNIRFGASIPNNDDICGLSGGTGQGRGWLRTQSNGSINTFIGGSGSTTIASAGTLQPNTTHNIKLATSPLQGQLVLYVDGIATGILNRNFETADGNFQLKRGHSGTTTIANATMGHSSWYKRTDNVIDLIVVCGQSNAVGQCGQTAPSNLDFERIHRFAYQLGATTPNATNINLENIDTRWGVELGMADTIFNDDGRTVAVLKVALGSTLLDGHWSPTQSMYEAFKTRYSAFESALTTDGYTIGKTTFVWVHGESDSNSESSANDYLTNFDAMMSGWESEVGFDPDVIYLTQTPLKNGAVRTYQSVVDSAKETIAARGDNKLLTTRDLGIQADGTHYDASALETLGARLGEEWLKENSYDKRYIFHAPLQEGSGSTAYDVSGNANHGTITSPSWTVIDDVSSWNHEYGFTDDSGVFVPGLESGVIANSVSCMEFDGTNDSVVYPHNQSFGNTLALAFYIKAPTPGAARFFLTKYESSGNRRAFYLKTETNGKISLTVSNNGSSTQLNVSQSNSVVLDNQLHHIQYLLTESGYYLYIDGELDKYSSVSQTLVPYSSDARIGLGCLLNGSTSQYAQGIFGGLKMCGHENELDVYLLVGQSNMVGDATTYGSLPTILQGRNVHLAEISVDLLYGITDDILQPVSGSKWGMELTAGQKLFARSNRRALFVKIAKGGSNMHTDWQQGGEMYNEFIAKYNTAKANVEADGYTLGNHRLVIMQGEADAGVTSNAQAWESNYDQMISDIQSDLNISIGQQVICRISDNYAGTTPGDLVRAAQDAVGSRAGNVLIDTDGISVRADNIHYDSDGLQELGNLVGEALEFSHIANDCSIHVPSEEGFGTTSYDVTGNSNHGVITGATWTGQSGINSWNYKYGYTNVLGVKVPALESGVSDVTGNPIGIPAGTDIDATGDLISNPPALDNDSEAALIQTDSVFTSGTASEWSADGATMDEVTFDQLVVHGTTNNGHDRLWVKVVDDIVVCIAQYNLDKNFTVTETLKNERYFGGTSAGLRDVNGDLITDSNGFVIFT